ncbi:hypothetical protein AAFF_G00311890 [Aldrovandia affinis]|uniref:Uncharacterized protein n=1 Tax=Aldrovandia affinis TaxID=143900 RepID=A0AAD7SN51_9TELE|nr:hypothetical protein AAFF_G00311890 [Aldrovandia affinis]
MPWRMLKICFAASGPDQSGGLLKEGKEGGVAWMERAASSAAADLRFSYVTRVKSSSNSSGLAS